MVWCGEDFYHNRVDSIAAEVSQPRAILSPILKGLLLAPSFLLDGSPQVNKLDFCVFLASCFGCLFYSIEFGLGIAVGLAILMALYQVCTRQAHLGLG